MITDEEWRAFMDDVQQTLDKFGVPQPEQDEIKAIEVELNHRYQAGDKSAELKEFWPSARRHIASGARFETGF